MWWGGKRPTLCKSHSSLKIIQLEVIVGSEGIYYDDQ